MTPQRHDHTAQNHKGPEFADSGAGAVHHGADDGVGDGVAHPHDGDHDGGEDAQMEDAGAKLGHIGQNQDKIDVGSAVVQGEQDQLIGLCRFRPFAPASGTSRFILFIFISLFIANGPPPA